MIESIIVAGLCFVVGLLVGQYTEKAKAQAAIVHHLMSTSGVLTIIRSVLEKHGLAAEADAELLKAGFIMKTARRE